MSPDLIVFEILIPRTDNRTGVVHPSTLFDEWVVQTAERFGGITVLGINLLGLWYDKDLPREANPVEDHSNWYKVGVEPTRVDELRAHVQAAAERFGQKCLYFQTAGEADFVPPLEGFTDETQHG